MVDLETLGKRPNAAILSVSAIHFDPYSDYIGKIFHRNIDLDSCIERGLTIDASCFHFWLDQKSKARYSLLECNIKELDDGLIEFSQFLRNNDIIYLWGNGINFDNVILKSAYISCKLEYPIDYKNDRDVRTIAGLVPKQEFNNIQNKIRENYKLIKHNSHDDAKFQILYLQKLFKHLNLRNYR